METGCHEMGLGVIGRNMVLNMADHGFPVAGYDKDPSQVEALQKEAALSLSYVLGFTPSLEGSAA